MYHLLYHLVQVSGGKSPPWGLLKCKHPAPLPLALSPVNPSLIDRLLLPPPHPSSCQGIPPSQPLGRNNGQGYGNGIFPVIFAGAGALGLSVVKISQHTFSFADIWCQHYRKCATTMAFRPHFCSHLQFMVLLLIPRPKPPMSRRSIRHILAQLRGPTYCYQLCEAVGSPGTQNTKERFDGKTSRKSISAEAHCGEGL